MIMIQSQCKFCFLINRKVKKTREESVVARCLVMCVQGEGQGQGVKVVPRLHLLLLLPLLLCQSPSILILREEPKGALGVVTSRPRREVKIEKISSCWV